MDKRIERTVIIIGTGLVGSVCACFMARRGYEVEVFEKRDDLRTSKEVRGRSINLALSHRGRKALRSLGLEEEILKCAIPMKGRMLHNKKGELKSVVYDPTFNECIYSVGRNFLNIKLLEAVAKLSNIKIYFNHLLTSPNFQEGSVRFINLKTCEEIEKKADLIIGADGAYSKYRLAMQQMPQFQYIQQYIEHGYLELSVPPDRGCKMTPNHLHIWPRAKFMMIALPNQNYSWTVTIFMPFEKFENLKSSEEVLNFFADTFPDSVDLIGKQQIVDTFLNIRPSQLVSIKCSPYHIGSKFLLIGDAAHAMVPFYGQGMNAGFEDCSILNDLLERNKDDFLKSVDQYNEIRVKNTHAICDLAMYNYIEMRDLVNTLEFRLRKKFDSFLYRCFPTKWIPLYNSVSFSSMEYHLCVRNRKWQDKVIFNVTLSVGIIIGLWLILFFNAYFF